MTLSIPSCRICHCTEYEACPGGCWWAPDPIGMGDLCSECVEASLALAAIDSALSEHGPGDARLIRELTEIDRDELVFLLDRFVDLGHLKRDVDQLVYALPWQPVQAA